MLERLGMTRDVLDRARRSRDARFDGKFFIAVTSTGIYCRSICPAKTSKDTNVRYYATAAEAAAAGFRPCRRCRPETAPGSPAWLGTSAVVRRALRLIQDGALDHCSVEELAARLGVGARHLSRLFSRHVGASPIAIAQTRRLHFAKQLLDETNLPITRIAFGAGFASVRRFNHAFKVTYQRSPREIRRASRRSQDAELKLRLTYRPPYDWERLIRCLARRAVPGLESVTPDNYQRTVRTARNHAIVTVSRVPGLDALELRIQGGESSELLALTSSVRRMFDLAADPAKIAEVLQRDPLLAAEVALHPGLRIPGCWDLFEGAVRLLIELTAASSAPALLTSLVECAGSAINDGTDSLYRLFPSPQGLERADLVALGFSPVLANALQCLARGVATRIGPGKTLSDSVSDALEDTRVKRALKILPTDIALLAQSLSLFGSGDPDAFPVSGEKDWVARAHLWRPFRGYAALHLQNISGPNTAGSRWLP
jgi:AraC family transcriptional regulator, regulatory protein of adaptative response / DNA-3-methyladenine glycosylase II